MKFSNPFFLSVANSFTQTLFIYHTHTFKKEQQQQRNNLSDSDSQRMH